MKVQVIMTKRVLASCWIGLITLATIPVNAAEHFPWMNEPYNANLGDMRRLDVRLLQLDGEEQDSLSARAVSFVDRVSGPETPHVPYARPYYRGRLNVLYLTEFTFGTDNRDIIELQQRLDADIKWFVFRNAHSMGLSKIILPRYLKLLDSDYDVIVYACSSVTLTEKFTKPLLEKVNKGVGFVCIESYARQNATNVKALSPLVLLRDKKANGPANPRLTCKDHPAVNGIPFGLMRYTYYGRAAAVPNAQAVASVNDDAVVAVGQYGKGRVVGICATDATSFARPELSGVCYRHWEYIFALRGRCALWAAGREPQTKMHLKVPAAIDFGTPLEAEVAVSGQQGLLDGSELKVTWYDDEHQAVSETTAKLAGEGTQKVVCPKVLRSGQTLVDARLFDGKGQAMDWASGGTIVKCPGAAVLKVEPIRFQEGQTVTLNVTGWRPENSRVHFKVTDAYRRLVFDQTTSESTATWKAEHVKGAYFSVTADIENPRGDIVLRQRGVATCPNYGQDDYYTYLWPGPMATYNLDLIMALDKECGLDGVCLPAWDESCKNWWYAAAANHMKIMGGNLATLWAEGGLPPAPLLSDAFRAYAEQRGFSRSLEMVRKFGATWASMADEAALVNEHNIGFDDFTLAAFRKDLRSRYPSVEMLNRHWGTAFKGWNQVKPAHAEEMKGRTNYAPWLEFRRFMDRRGGQQMGEYVRALKGAAGTPDLPVGIEGIFGFSTHHVPYGLLDFAHMMQDVGMSLATYNAPECFQEGGGEGSDSDLDSFLNPQPAPGAWVGYFMPKWQQALQPWWSAFHGFVGCCYFEGAVFMNTAGAKYDNARWIEQPTRPLRQGVGKLLMNSKRQFDPVAIYFDMGNFQLAWIVAQTQSKGFMQRMVADGKASLERILQDLAVTPGWVTGQSIAKGALKNYKMLILTGALRLSKETLQSLREFAENGGVIVADGLTGMYDETGKPTDPNYIKDLFGVVRKTSDVKMLPGQYTLGKEKRSELFTHLPPVLWVKATMFEEGLAVDGGNALGGHVAVAAAPGFVEKKIGKGKTLLINAINATYYQDADPFDLDLWKGLLADANITPRVQVYSEGAPLSYYDVKLFSGRGLLLAGIIRSPHFGAINPANVDLTFEKEGDLYEVISGKYLGRGKSAR